MAYYRRRAGEYDLTAYGDLGAAPARITRIVVALRPAGNGSEHRLVNVFIHRGQLRARPNQLGWQSHVRRDGNVGVTGEARPANP